ncbi:MAG: hypothetical protein ACI90Q_001301 [Nonlabens sp.]|jgi:hypothetical protein
MFRLQRYVIFFLTPQTTVKQLVKNTDILLNRSGLDVYLFKLMLLTDLLEKENNISGKLRVEIPL